MARKTQPWLLFQAEVFPDDDCPIAAPHRKPKHLRDYRLDVAETKDWHEGRPIAKLDDFLKRVHKDGELVRVIGEVEVRSFWDRLAGWFSWELR